MKKFVFLCAVLAIFGSCASRKNLVKIVPLPVDVEVADSVSYELVVFDNHFETWYQLKNSPALSHSQDYYENWNRQYVTAWNLKSMEPGRNGFFEPIVGWEPTADYGFELNHKLFYYFMYVEHELKIPILDNGQGPLNF